MAECRQIRRRHRWKRGEERASAETPSPRESDPLAQLAFIRQTMESASSFTAVPGMGMVGIGMTALAAAALAARQPSQEMWLAVWVTEAVAALAIALYTMASKARRSRQAVISVPARKFAASFAPPMLVGAILTLVFYQQGVTGPIHSMWLMLYGTAVITGGAFSVGIVPVMGLCFLGLGVASVFTPPAFTDWEMALGFGALHLVFGALVAKRHGG